MFAVAFVLGVAAMAVASYYRDKGLRAKVNEDVAALHIEVINVRAKLAAGEAVVEADWEKAKTLFNALSAKL